MDSITKHKELLYITFHSKEDIIRFVNTCQQYDDAIDVIVDKVATDAKSILGMLLIPTEEPVCIDYGCYDEKDDYQEFRSNIMQHFEVKAVSIANKEMSLVV